jgi:hypothetical protein
MVEDMAEVTEEVMVEGTAGGGAMGGVTHLVNGLDEVMYLQYLPAHSGLMHRHRHLSKTLALRVT